LENPNQLLSNIKLRGIMPVVKISKHFQITLPKEIRDELKVGAGDHIQLEIKNGRVFFEPVKIIPVRDMGEESR